MLSTQALHFSYQPSADPVLDDVWLRLEAGSVTALTGPSGSGKSTLLYLLALMLQPTSGQVLWDGESTADLADAQRSEIRAQRAGFVFQDAMLDASRSVLDNVCEAAVFAGMARKSARRRGRELLEEFGVQHRIDHRPGEISGGQAQRVALCRALITDPVVVFGDEPTGNLDAASAEVVWQALLTRARNGACVVIATHDRELAGRAHAHVELT